MKQQNFIQQQTRRSERDAFWDLVDRFKQNVSIGVVYSSEPVRSTRSSIDIHGFLGRGGYQAAAAQVAESLTSHGFTKVELVSDGKELRNALAKGKIDLFWLQIPKMPERSSPAYCAAELESLGIPFIGHSATQYAILNDNVLLKPWLRGIGLSTSPFIVRHGGADCRVDRGDPDFLREFGPAFNGPFLVRTASGGMASEARFVGAEADLSDAVFELNSLTNNRIVVESLSPGRNFTIWAGRGYYLSESGWLSRQQSLTFGGDENCEIMRSCLSPASNRETSQLIHNLTGMEEHLSADLEFIARRVFLALGLTFPIAVEASLTCDNLLSVVDVHSFPDTATSSFWSGSLLRGLNSLPCSYPDFVYKIFLDWLDYNVKYTPALLRPLGNVLRSTVVADLADKQAANT